MSRQREVTALLSRLSSGDASAVEALMPIVYDELKNIAHRQLRSERDGHTLNTTALVHEAYMKLVNLDRIEWQNRAHFLALAAQAMRRILVNYAIRMRAEKRGGGKPNKSIEHLQITDGEVAEDVIALDEALERLSSINERASKVVTYRFFSGLSVAETAEVLGVSGPTIKRDWQFARAWLNKELQD